MRFNGNGGVIFLIGLIDSVAAPQHDIGQCGTILLIVTCLSEQAEIAIGRFAEIAAGAILARLARLKRGEVRYLG